MQSNLPNVTFDYVPERPGDVRETLADISPLLKLGWRPDHYIKSGISKCFEDLKNEL